MRNQPRSEEGRAMPRFGLRRKDIEEVLGVPALRARQEQAGWKLASSRNPHDLAEAEGQLQGVNEQIATLEALARVIELNNQQLLHDLQRLLGAARRPAGSPPPRVTSAEAATHDQPAAPETNDA